MSPNNKGAVIALTGFAIFAAHDAIVKYLGGFFGPFQIVFFTVLFGFPWLAIMLVGEKTEASMRPRHPWWVALRALCVVISMIAGFYAFSVLPLAQTYSILFATPLVITLLAIPMLGERVGLHRGVAIAVGLLGVLVVVQPGATPITLGHAAAFVAVATSALGSVVVRKIGRDERNLVLVLLPMLASFAIVGALLPLDYKPLSLADLGIFALLALLSIAAINLMVVAYKLGEAATIAPMQYSQILWATFFGFVFFDELPTNTTFVGAGIIIASGIYIVWRESGGAASENTPVLRTKSRPVPGGIPVRAFDHKTKIPPE